MLHLIYRSYGGENARSRPAFYSKLVALVSFVRAVGELAVAFTGEPLLHGRGEIVFLNDGPIPAERLHVMEQSGEVLARSGMGMKGSMRTALALPAERGWAKDDLVWFAEDDYLYLPSAIASLSEAAGAFPEASYFGLYASIGHRPPEGGTQPDYAVVPSAWRDTEPVIVRGHPWRRALSTTSTFGARVGPLEDDRLMMRAAMRLGGPWDHHTCLIYQGFMPYPAGSIAQFLRDTTDIKHLARRAATSVARIGLNGYQAVRVRAGYSGRLLVAPDPPLATHMQSGHVSLGTDWSAVAEDAARWGISEGLIQAPYAAVQTRPRPSTGPRPSNPHPPVLASPLDGPRTTSS